MDNYYDTIASGYDELHGDEQLKKLNLIKDHIEINKTDKLLDVGCGTGISTSVWDCQCTGIDPSNGLLDLAVDKKRIRYILTPAENIPFDENTFDIVISITAIQNFKDIKKGLKEIKRVGKNCFVLTFLKKSLKSLGIEEMINQMFSVKTRLEEDKDIIMICE